MIYKNEYSDKENPLVYFDAIFYIYQENAPNVAMNFLTKRLGANYVFLKMAIITDESGQPDLKKTKEVIFNKSRRHNFQKVLAIQDFPEAFYGELMSHLGSIVHHMKTQEWKYWHIRELSENRLESTFSEELCEKLKPCFSMAFNRTNIN